MAVRWVTGHCHCGRSKWRSHTSTAVEDMTALGIYPTTIAVGKSYMFGWCQEATWEGSLNATSPHASSVLPFRRSEIMGAGKPVPFNQFKARLSNINGSLGRRQDSTFQMRMREGITPHWEGRGGEGQRAASWLNFELKLTGIPPPLPKYSNSNALFVF